MPQILLGTFFPYINKLYAVYQEITNTMYFDTMGSNIHTYTYRIDLYIINTFGCTAKYIIFNYKDPCVVLRN